VTNPDLSSLNEDVVAVQLSGGLGNQLFQYAAGRAASLRLGCRLWLDLSSLVSTQEGVTKRDFELGPCLLKATPLLIPGEGWAEYRQDGFAFDPEFEAVGPGCKMIGGFQSELFFASAREEVRRDLTAPMPHDPAFSSLLAGIWEEREPVAVHVRRGDYKKAATQAYHGLLGRSYYAKAIDHLVQRCDPSRVFLFSDDPDEASELLDGLCDFTVVEGDPSRPWRDMKLMAACSHHVMANSSFSWWGSWLSDNPGKIAVAPYDWFARPVMRRLNTIDLHRPDTVLIRPDFDDERAVVHAA
jgi:hypothetical protein